MLFLRQSNTVPQKSEPKTFPQLRRRSRAARSMCESCFARSIQSVRLDDFWEGAVGSTRSEFRRTFQEAHIGVCMYVRTYLPACLSVCLHVLGCKPVDLLAGWVASCSRVVACVRGVVASGFFGSVCGVMRLPRREQANKLGGRPSERPLAATVGFRRGFPNRVRSCAFGAKL